MDLEDNILKLKIIRGCLFLLVVAFLMISLGFIDNDYYVTSVFAIAPFLLYSSLKGTNIILSSLSIATSLLIYIVFHFTFINITEKLEISQTFIGLIKLIYGLILIVPCIVIAELNHIKKNKIN